MELLYIGDIVGTHGLKGEVRILSSFSHKELVFKSSMHVWVGKTKEELVIASYRPHKNFDMVTFEGISSIDDVILYKGDAVYVKRSDLDIKDYLNEDLLYMDVYQNNICYGVVCNILKTKAHDILVIEKDGKKQMIPCVSEFIKKVDLENRCITIESIEGLINEN